MATFRTLDLAKQFYRVSKDLKLPPHLKEQFLRSSSSIALNLAEGNAKMSEREKLRFYEIAHGSFRESVTILELGEAGNEELDRIADQLGGSLFQLTRALSFRIIGKK